MSTNCPDRIRTKRRVIAIGEQTCCGVAETTSTTTVSVLDGSTITPVDENLAIEATGGRMGVVENLGAQAHYEVSYPVRVAGGNPSEMGLLLKGSAHVLATTTVMEVNTLAGGAIAPGDTLTNTTQVNDVGIVGDVHPLFYVNGNLTVNGVFLIGVSTISIANSGTALLKTGDTFEITGDAQVYTLTSDASWTNCAGSNQDVSFSPTLAQDTVGAEIVTVTGRYRVSMFTVDNAPVATDAVEVTASGVTGVINAITNDAAQVFYPTSEDSELTYLTAIDNWDNKQRIAYDLVGNVAFEATGGDYPRMTFTAMGLYTQVTDEALVAATACLTNTKLFENVQVVFDGRDMRDLSVTAFTLDAGVAFEPVLDVQVDKNLKGYMLSNQLPVGTLNLEQTDVATFEPDIYRDNETIFPLTIIHNQSGDADERIIFSIPATQLNAYAAPSDDAGKQVHSMTYSANIACGTSLPKYMIYIF